MPPISSGTTFVVLRSLRWSHSALRGDAINVFHVHEQNRVIAFQRWISGLGRNVVRGGNAQRVDVVRLRDRFSR
jgi:hypothetical protein